MTRLAAPLCLLCSAPPWPAATTGRSGAARTTTAQPARRPARRVERDEERRLEAAAARHGRLHAGRLGRPHLPDQPRTATTSSCCASAPTARSCGSSKLGTRQARSRGDEGNDASPSPSTDGKHVCAFVGTGDLACFDFDGKEVWQFNAQERYGKFNIQFGMHSTPLLHGDRLYLQLHPLRRRLGRSPSTRPPARKSGRSSRQSDGTRRERALLRLAVPVAATASDALPGRPRQRLRHRPPPRRRQGDLAARRPQPARTSYNRDAALRRLAGRRRPT